METFGLKRGSEAGIGEFFNKLDRSWYYFASSSIAAYGGSQNRVSAKSSSRKPAVPKVATYRILTQLILTQLREYRRLAGGAGAGRRGACSGLSTPCMRMHNLAGADRGVLTLL